MFNTLLSPAVGMANVQLYIIWCHVTSILAWLNTISSRCGQGHHVHVIKMMDQLGMHTQLWLLIVMDSCNWLTMYEHMKVDYDYANTVRPVADWDGYIEQSG